MWSERGGLTSNLTELCHEDAVPTCTNYRRYTSVHVGPSVRGFRAPGILHTCVGFCQNGRPVTQLQQIAELLDATSQLCPPLFGASNSEAARRRVLSATRSLSLSKPPPQSLSCATRGDTCKQNKEMWNAVGPSTRSLISYHGRDVCSNNT